jgi:hypothetical protein
MTRTLHKDQCTFFIMFHTLFLKMRNFSGRSGGETRNTHFMFNNFPPPLPKNYAAYGIMWKNTVKPGRPQKTIWRMGIACIKIQTHTLRMCNTYYFSSATMVARTRLSVTLCVHCPFRLNYKKIITWCVCVCVFTSSATAPCSM